ncbi:hypothetical protein CTAYLR_001229 [Chrysophaeum taylorii]|uniref:Peptidyl-prolyl cis-trans isomerase n=1 Tax=Chrysophaeum taylorii TaxID=2483200 RepID=A0AAD7XI84_9STRA|nr:hypothetical protein CTAYLR_001229 [Chrysophaeum taylorii]
MGASKNVAGARVPATYSGDAALRKSERKGPQYDDTRESALREDLVAERSVVTRPLLEGGEADWEYEIREYVPGERNPIVFFDVAISGEAVGRIEFTLRDDVVPRACENFRCLCTGERGRTAEGAALWYKGSRLHRVIPDFVAQGGDITKGNGSGGVSIYGAPFEDETFDLRHDRRGTLSMATTGGANTSQFFLALRPCDFLDGKHVVFGYVSAGLEVLDLVEDVGTTQGRTRAQVTIANCGQLA